MNKQNLLVERYELLTHKLQFQADDFPCVTACPAVSSSCQDQRFGEGHTSRLTRHRV